MDEGGAVPGEPGGAIVSMHRGPRGAPATNRLDPPATRFPGPVFTLPTPYPRAAEVDVRGLEPPFLVLELAETIWNDHHHNLAFRSYGGVRHAVDAVRCFTRFLSEEDGEGRILSLLDLKESDIDHFDLWAHGSWPEGSSAPFQHLDHLLTLLRGAQRYGLTSPTLTGRLEYASRFHKPAKTTPRDAYSPYVMEQIRQGARTAVRRTVLRMSAARKLRAKPGTPPSGDEQALLFMRDVAFIADDKNFTRVLRRAGHASLVGLQDQIYPGLPDLLPFAILIADDCGLPPECINELSEDCLEVFNEDVGLGRLSYKKRRRDPSNPDFDEVVKTKGRWSTGWLISLLLKVTATARRQMPRNYAGRLFVGRWGASLKSLNLNHPAMAVHLARYPVEDDDGKPLEAILLSRIRKTNKADRYTRAGGDLHRIGKDHTKQVFARNYAVIGALQGTHDAAVEAGLRDGLRDALAATRVAADEPSEAAEVKPDSADLWLARCLDYGNSPYANEETRSCGAPFWGCLDCRNAVVTRSKLPNLLRLLGHLRDKRQEMSLDEFQRGFGFAFVRLQQIIAKFDRADVEAAIAENADFSSAHWSLAQLAYVV